ncbi:MAG TPA: Ig-like domain-containing protein [Polyangiaceae bacterium]
MALPQAANAQVGPGLGNLDCGDAEYFEPFAFIENNSGPNGTNASLIIRGYFMTLFAPDSGHPPGELGIYDVSNPKAPMEVRHYENADTDVFREAHSLPVALIDDGQYVAIQTISGIQFWDFTDPLAAERVGNIDLPGVAGGDYENVAWQTTWQGRYLYVSGGNQGIYIVDAADPENPELLTQVPTSQTGGFRVGPLFALGDYLVISNMDQGGAYSILDISIPDEPALLGRVGNLPRMYAIVVGGNDRIYSAGRDGNFVTHSFTDPTDITLIKDAMIGEDQLYAAAQDHFVFLGRQNNVIKLDVTDEQNPMVVGQGDLGRDHPDHGQVTPMGNLIYIGNDHGSGSAFFCHQHGRDMTPPAVQSTFPKDGSLGVLPSARVSLLFSDYIDTETVSSESVIIRPAGGQALDGIFTYAFNTLSFGPSAPLAADTTYEVVLPAGGLSDVTGNALSEEVLLRFSTGSSIEIPPEDTTTSGSTTTGGEGGSTAASTDGGSTTSSAQTSGTLGGASNTAAATSSSGTGMGTSTTTVAGPTATVSTTGSAMAATSDSAVSIGAGGSQGGSAKSAAKDSGCSIGVLGGTSTRDLAGLALFALALVRRRRSRRPA